MRDLWCGYCGYFVVCDANGWIEHLHRCEKELSELTKK